MKWTFTTLTDWLGQWVPKAPLAVSGARELSRLNYADELAAAKRPLEALSIYASVIRSNPDELGAYVNAASLCLDHNEHEAAIGILRAGLARAPQNTHLWTNLAAALSHAGQHEAALEASVFAVQYGPENAMAYYNRAECWSALNQMILAIRDLETANRLDPMNQEISRRLWLSRLALAPPLEQYADAQYEPNAHGYELVDGVEVRATLQCPHCGDHFPSIKGSKIERTWCSHCGDITCGKLKCRECVPFRKKLELIEKDNRQLTG